MAKKAFNVPDETGARSKFGNAKSISSDMYFERGVHAPMDNEASMRLQQFNGAQSISSAQFYNRDEAELNRKALPTDLSQAVDVAESLAKDFAKTFISQAKDDINTVRPFKAVLALIFHFQVTQAAQIGANKLQDFIRDLQTRY